MPEQFLHLSVNDRKTILETAATQLGQQAAVLEKDVWVCWALQALFSIPNAHPMAFKGGTSLSKVYRIIDRFSEDLDITLDYEKFKDAFNPFAEDTSKNAIKKFSDRLKAHVHQYAKNVIYPYIESRLQLLPTPEEYSIDISDDGEKIWIHYPSAIEDTDEYLQSSILIELGGRNVINPNEQHTVSPYIAELVTGLELPSGQVNVLSPQRTFWEKATLIHVECNRNKLKANADRLSRHWYDLVMLAQHPLGKAALSNKELLNNVVKHKQVFFSAPYANYDACLANEFRLVPDDTLTTELQRDYKAMTNAGMMYGESLSFDRIMDKIHEIENVINEN